MIDVNAGSLVYSTVEQIGIRTTRGTRSVSQASADRAARDCIGTVKSEMQIGSA